MPGSSLTADPVLTGLAVGTYTIPTDAPEGDGTFAWNSTTMVVVRACTADCVGHRRQCRSDAAGRPQCQPERPGRLRHCRSGLRPLGPEGTAAGTSPHRLLGAVRDNVAVYGSGGFTTYSHQQLADQLGGWVHGQQIPRVKIKIGQDRGTSLQRDLDRISQARTIIGDDAELFVDANGAYTAKQAVRVFEAAHDSRVAWFEEPVSSDHLAGLRTVRESIEADVAAGEYGTDLFYFQRMCQAEAVDCLQVDVSRCGGITQWLRIAALAGAHGLEVLGHCAPNLSAQVAAATPNFRHLEWFHDHVRIEKLAFDGTLDPAGGAITPRRDSPGNGLDFRSADIEQFRVA